MKQNLWREQLERLIQPQYIIIYIVLFGLFINLILYFFIYNPAYAEHRAHKESLTSLDHQIQQLESRPIPEQISETDANWLVLQVPTKDEVSRFIYSLRQIENDTSALLQNVQFSGNGESSGANVSELEQTIRDMETNTEEQNNQVESSRETKESPFHTLNLRVKLTGSYVELMDFIREIHQLERIVKLSQWNLSPLTQPEERSEPLLSMDVTLQIYTALQYDGYFEGLPELPVILDRNRLIPILSDDEFYERLRNP